MKKEEFTAVVARAMAGDTAAYAQLCECIVQEVLYMCIRYTGDYHAGEDAAQEVLVYLQKNIRRLRQADAFYAWLNRVIIGVCANLARKTKRLTAMAPEELSADMMEDKLEFLPPEWAEKEETRALVLDALHKLPLRQQQAMYMFYLQDMSVKDIARALEVSENTAKVTLHRARNALKGRIEKDNRINLEEYSLKGLAAAPMALLLRADLQSLASREAAARVLQAVGAAAGLGAAGAGTAAAATAGAGTTATAATAAAVGTASSSLLSATALALTGTALAGIALGGALLVSSSASPPPMESMPPQQSVFSDALQAEAGEEISLQDINTSIVLEESSRKESTIVSSVPLSSAAAVAAAPASFGQTVQGALALAADGAEVPGSGRYAAGFVAAVYHGEQQLASATVGADGAYSLSFEAWPGDAYTLYLYPPGSRHCGFASGAGVESISFAASAGESRLPTVYLVDLAAPTGAVEFTGDEGTGADVVNPGGAQLYADDETELALSWQLLGPDGQVAGGSGGYAPLEGLAGTAEGTQYEIVFAATDAGGNTAEFRRVFWRQIW